MLSAGSLISPPIENMYYEKMKEFLGEGAPTVKLFKEKVKNLNAEEQDECYRTVYRAAQTEWGVMNKSYRHFCVVLIERNLQRFLDYMRMETFWADFVTPTKDSETLLLLIYQTIRFRQKRKTSMRILAFGLLLLFGSNNKIDTLCRYWKSYRCT
jgi:hypothetical protein